MSDLAVVDEVPDETVREALALLELAAGTDGRSALSEQGLLHLRGAGEPRPGVRHLLLRAESAPGDTRVPHADRPGTLVAYGQLDGTDPVEAPAAEFAVHPEHRRRGHGRTMAQALLEASGGRLRVWAHGDHPGARHLARTLGLRRFRELRQMRLAVNEMIPVEPRLPEGVTVRPFVPGQDDAAWLAVNAAAFAHHPEQGSLTQRDLDDRKGETWFDPAGFFLAVRRDPDSSTGDRIVGFHWTKVHREGAEGLGEVYVVGVLPEEQGNGLGRALTLIGLRYLAYDRGVATVLLYVDADNTAAVTVYERLGFTTHEVDLMYRTEG